MKRVLLAVLTLLGAGAAHAQAAPAEVEARIDRLAAQEGMKRFGPSMARELPDRGLEQVVISVDPARDTFVLLLVGPDAIGVRAWASRLSGSAITKEQTAYGKMQVVLVPAGSGREVELSVKMSCDWDRCPYAIQALVE